MRKNILALSIAAMIGGLGFAAPADVVRGARRVRFRNSDVDLDLADHWGCYIVPYWTHHHGSLQQVTQPYSGPILLQITQRRKT